MIDMVYITPPFSVFSSRIWIGKLIKMKEPWKKDTNERYLDMVKSVVNLSTASLLLPVFFARNFFNVQPNIPLSSIFGGSIYIAWVLFAISVFCGLCYQYLSAKWMRKAWGKSAGLLWCKDNSESTLERIMEVCLWCNVVFFFVGVALTVHFFINSFFK